MQFEKDVNLEVRDVSVLQQLSGEKLQGNGTAEGGVLGFVDHAHAAATELLQDAVVGNRLADHEEPPKLAGILEPARESSQCGGSSAVLREATRSTCAGSGRTV